MRGACLPIIDVAQPINWAASLNRNLISWWMNLPSGQWGRGTKWYDLNRAKGNDATLVNAPPWRSTPRPGGFGSLSMQELDHDDLLTFPDMSASITTQATFSMWLKLNSHTPSFGAGAWFWNTADFSCHYPYTDGTIYDATFTTTRTTVGSGVVADRSQWHQVCITSAPGANGRNFYQNGALAASTTGDSSISLSTAPYVGMSQDQQYYLTAHVDDIRLYNRALTASEVAQLYLRSRAGYANELNYLRRTEYAAAAATSSGLLLRRRRAFA